MSEDIDDEIYCKVVNIDSVRMIYSLKILTTQIHLKNMLVMTKQNFTKEKI